jgi:hypothetical protein
MPACGSGATQSGATTPCTLLVCAVEVTDDGKRKDIPPTGATDVDVNSSVELVVNEEKVREAFAANIDVDPKRLEALQARSKLLSEESKKQKQEWEALKQLLEIKLTDENVVKISKQVGALEKAARKTVDQLITRNEYRAVLAANPGRTAPEIVLGVIEAELEKVKTAIDAEAKGYARARFRMQATLLRMKGPLEFVHLDGYDNLPQTDARLIDKLALPVDLLATLDSARDAAKDIGNFRTVRDRTVQAGGKKLDELVKRLTDVSEVKELVDQLESELKTKKQAAGVVAALRELQTATKTVFSSCKPLLDKAPTAELSSLLDATLIVSGCLTAVQGAVTAADTAKTKVIGAVSSLRETVRADAALAKELGAEALSKLETLDNRLKDLALSEIEKLLRMSPGQFPTPTDAMFAAEHLTDRGYEEIRDTKVDLLRTSREKGDLLYYRASVVTDEGEKSPWTSAPIKVVASGWHVDVSASVVFVRAFEQEPQDSSFPAAPAATAAFHHRSVRDSGENAGSSFWNLLDPGLGLHVAYLDLGPVQGDSNVRPNDPSMEIGVGGTFQLFGDVIQAGAAYDLQVERPYFFFGVGLQTLTKFGLTVPSSKN